MEKAKTFFTILGLGITIGVIVVVFLLFVIRATPKSVIIGGVEFEIPTPTVYQRQEPTPDSPNPVVLPTTQPLIAPTSPSEDKWACVQQADSTQQSTWETCWRYIQIDSAGSITEASKENANAIEWVGPTDLSYTTLGQYHSDYMSEWYIWATQKKSVRFCIDVNTTVQVEGKVENLLANCYLWQRGPFMVELP